MPYDWGRLATAVSDARRRQRMTQTQLAERAGVDRSTVKNLEGARPFSRWPNSIGAIEIALGKPEGWARAIAEDRELPGTSADDAPLAGEPTQRSSLIDPNSADPVIRELSTGPVRSDAFREELIRLYLDDLEEGRRRAEERAAERVRRLASAAYSEAEAEMQRKLDQLRELEAEDTAQDSDDPGQGASSA
jgi:transcriptional regulator with XRE-family HTH domain